jgi:hypothetical protein
LDHSTGSSKSFDLAKYWLQKCIHSHAICAQYCAKDLSLLPTRVVDVDVSPNRVDVRLLVSRGRRAPYIALSHCWGATGTVITTTANLAERQRNIPFSSLSRNFQDAVIATRALGVRYLWIDSLCIIQDSREDWDFESARMGDVYRNALCTISAAKSSDGNGGCFVSRDSRGQRPIRLPLEGSLETPDGEQATDGDIYLATSRWPRPLGPLYQRGWVFQEQALSGRTLAFTTTTMFWSCLTCTTSETHPCGYTTEFYGDGSLESFRVLASGGVLVQKEDRRNIETDPYLIWYTMICDYSKRSLTYDTDRLPALSAVASEMSQHLNDEYIAGLWRGDFLRGLYWACQGNRGLKCGPPGLYVAPSWSWASMKNATISMDFVRHRDRELKDTELNDSLYSFDDEDGESGEEDDDEQYDEDEYDEDVYDEEESIEDDDADRECDEDEDMEDEEDEGNRTIEILEINCTPSGQNRFGQVNQGTIRLVGWVKKAILRLHGPKLVDTISGEEIGGMNFDQQPHSGLENSEVWCLYLCTHRPRSHIIGGRITSTCLALLPTGFTAQECRRIGITGIDPGPWGDGFERMTLILV